MAAMLPGIKKQPFRPRGQMTAVPPLLHGTLPMPLKPCHGGLRRGILTQALFPRALGTPRPRHPPPDLHPLRLALGNPARYPVPHRFPLLYMPGARFARGKSVFFRRDSAVSAAKPRHFADFPKNIGKMTPGVLTGDRRCGLMYSVLRFRIPKLPTSIRSLELVNFLTCGGICYGHW